jgi:hypothetical protein
MTDFEERAKRVAKELEDAGEETTGDAELAPAPEPAPVAKEETEEETEDEEEGEEEGEEDEEEEEEEAPAPVPAPAPAPASLATQGGGIVVEAPAARVSALSNPNAAMLFLKADKTAEDATWLEALVDHTVQFGQPYPAITHCEMWIGERASMPADDNHFSTYLGASEGAMWTSGLSDSARFYGCNQPTDEDLTRRMARSSWSAIPIFAVDGAQRLRRECNLHAGTPYPPSFLLWQYPMSTWPLRAFSGLVDDKMNAPAHCAALSARILRTTLPETHTLEHPSHWYGPSSLYLELASPMRMELALAREQPTVRAQVQEEELNEYADTLVQHSDDEVAGMRAEDAHKALRQLAIHVLRAGSRVDDQEVNQDEFREAQERYAFGLCRYSWKFRKSPSRV